MLDTQVSFKAGDTIGLTWTSTGNVPFDSDNSANYCNSGAEYTTINGPVSLDLGNGNRVYSFAAMYI